MACCGGRQQEIPAAADEVGIEGVFREGQVDDGLRGFGDGPPALLLDQHGVEHRELPAVDLERLARLGEGEHQPLGARALDVLRLDARREQGEFQGLAARPPAHWRAGDLDARDDPVLFRLAPQRKGHRAAAERFAPALAGEHVLQFVVLQQLAGL